MIRRAGALVVGGLLFLQSGGGTGLGHAVKQINGASVAPVPSVAPPAVARPDSVWVPDRYIPAPDTGSAVRVPAHWERRVSDHESYVPPLSTLDPADGRVQAYPAGVRAPAEVRSGP